MLARESGIPDMGYKFQILFISPLRPRRWRPDATAITFRHIVAVVLVLPASHTTTSQCLGTPTGIQMASRGCVIFPEDVRVAVEQRFCLRNVL